MASSIERTKIRRVLLRTTARGGHSRTRLWKIGSSMRYCSYMQPEICPVFQGNIGLQTERYYEGDLIYSFDIPKDGNYVIIMKFSEVYFNSPGEKVFHVHVNDIPVKRNMDIFKEVGAAGAAYDLYVDISVNKKELTIGDLIGDIDGELQIRLVPVNDNPKINAIAILTGTSETLPPPPPLPQQETQKASSRRRSRKEVIDDDDEEEEEEAEPITEQSEPRAWQEPVREVASGPRTRNPFEDKNDNVFVYLGVTLVCLLPVVAFLMHM
ncbi:hypothetical protein ANCCAN_13657 [Ancylostoma caninum]|uniref:Malectin domain-containing protein n=1 Tax=Ancylostoma caninum TaxID=29170 RepID=A0A368G7K4_ANCCA|nr:hypothetical protein ANCCAN_13657 [Ancylostoma caninum]